MSLITRFGPPLKCLFARLSTCHLKTKIFGGVIPNKIRYFECYSFHQRIIHRPAHSLERIVANYHVVKRFKHRKRREEESSDSEDEEAETIEDVGKDFKILKLRVNSLRCDLILKAALGMARNKVEAAFFQSKIRLNGVVLVKKSIQLKVEDEVDLVRGTSNLNPGFLVVSRVKIHSYSEKEDKYIVTAQCFRSLTIENYSDHPWKKSE